MKDRLNIVMKMLEEEPKDAFLRFAFAMELKKLNKIEKSIEQLNIIKENEPTYLGLYYQLGQLLEMVEKYEQALKVYEEGIVIAKAQNDQKAISELNEVLFILNEELEE